MMKKTGVFVVECSLVGVVLNGLSHLSNCKNKKSFVAALIAGKKN